MSLLTKTRHPAYHLRPNKAIDRLLFLEIIRALELYTPLSKHTYVGFGGPFLDDFRLIAHAFPMIKLVSIEEDGETHKRQNFHQCSRRLSFYHGQFSDYLGSSFPSATPTITWADYTEMKRECLLEVADIVRKATPLSLLRVTVRAETQVYAALNLLRRPVDLPTQKQAEFADFVKSFKADIAVDEVAYDEDLFVWKNFRDLFYPSLLARILIAVMEASSSHPKAFVPLHAAMYSDGTIMLSVTGVLCSEDKRSSLINHFSSQSILKPGAHLEVEEIDVPLLTTKERLFLEPFLPSEGAGGKCLKQLGYLPEGDNSEIMSGYKMRQYEKYHRFYPFFGKLIP